MDQNQNMDVLYQLKKQLLSASFIEESEWNRNTILEYLEHPDHLRGIENIILQGNYNTKTIYSLYEPLIRSLAPAGLNIDFLTQFHNYSVNLSFPETEPFMSGKGIESLSKLFLKIMKVYCELQRTQDKNSWQGLYPIVPLTSKEEAELESAEEYQRFKFFFKQDFVYEMMKMNQDLKGYTTLDHVCGVYHIAMKVARQLRRTGVKLDMGRVAGAAAGHDVGKYGCRGDEKKRVAYFHYHYTGVWFEKRNITYIRRVAINHSTWDLELDNLPIEALILIYADFRVKADDKGDMTFYNLDDSFQVILDKLDQVDEAKENRYKRVYRKLKDFEDFMISLGIILDPKDERELPEHYERERIHPSLLTGQEIVDYCKNLSIEHNIRLMYLLRDENSMNRLLESARSMKNTNDLRGYIDIIEDYSPYLTQKQKQIAIGFLYGILVSPEEDIRKHCSWVIGRLIGNFDEELRKEIPSGAEVAKFEVESYDLLERYIERLLIPELHIIGKHRHWTSYCLKDVLKAYFSCEHSEEKQHKSMSIAIHHLKRHSEDSTKQLYILHALRGLPLELMAEHELIWTKETLLKGLSNPDEKIRMATLNALGDISKMCSPIVNYFDEITEALADEDREEIRVVERYTRKLILERLGKGNRLEYVQYLCEGEKFDVSALYLTNLKSVTNDVVKKFQVKFLVDYAKTIDKNSIFYTSMHLCNLLKVSALESVRNTAGESLVELIDELSVEQRNDIVVELLRALEMESYQFTRYIPAYLGRILLKIKPIELDEVVEDFQDKIKRSGTQLGMLLTRTVSEIIRHYGSYGYSHLETPANGRKRLEKLVGILLNGFVSYVPSITQTAMTVLGREILSDPKMPISEKKMLLDFSLKKVLSLLNITDEKKELIFMSNASGLKHIYRLISDYEHQFGQLMLPVNNRVAFFPGSFDPFSVSHKQIAKEIRNLGFEVYLAVDEFSWSKRTLPNLIRRDIIKMSIADEINIYSYPRDLSINLSNEKDLEKLKKSFEGRNVFMVVGSDVIVNATAYKKGSESEIHNMPHIIFERMIDEDTIHKEHFEEAFSRLDARSIRLILPPQYEQISSTQIRNYIDENRDITELVDPLAQRYIYDKGLYQREPQYKEVMTTKSTVIEILTELSSDTIEELARTMPIEFSKVYSTFKALREKESFKVLILRSVAEKRSIIGFACFHWLRSSQMYTEFSDDSMLNYLRDHAVGRMLVIDGICARDQGIFKNAYQLVLTETLAHCLARDYTYAICHNAFDHHLDSDLVQVLIHQGFVKVPSNHYPGHIYAVNMSTPCTLNLDIKSLIKEPFRNDPEVVKAIGETRKKMQEAIVKLYPGHLVLSFDRTMIYETLIKKICDENQMPTVPLHPKQVGSNMCVPFGDIIKRWILPNTVTKAIHIEKYFYPELDGYKIEAYPYYLDIENQMEMLKSFNRSILMVDDILDKGYRIKVIEPALRRHNIPIQKIFVGILSGHGKALMASKNIDVDCAYFIPRLRVWFNEGKLYPFFGGDAVWRDYTPERNMIPSVNLILPYASPTYIKGTRKAALFEVSKVAIENAISILKAIEDRYQEKNDRMLTVARLGEVMSYPRYPDKGRYVAYDMNQKASDYLALDLENLNRLRKMYVGKESIEEDE